MIYYGTDSRNVAQINMYVKSSETRKYRKKMNLFQKLKNFSYANRAPEINSLCYRFTLQIHRNQRRRL